MKTTLNVKGIAGRRGERGYVMVVVVFMAALSLMVMAATLSRTGATSRLNSRNNSYLECLSASEAGTERIVARMISDYRNGGDALVTANLGQYRTNVPSASDSPYWSSFVFSDAMGNLGRTYVQVTSNYSYVQLESQYAGLGGFATGYRVISNARPASGQTSVVNAVQQDLQLATIPVFQFAIFYSGLLEFTWAAPFTVRGRTHSNGSIYTGSSQNLTFEDYVTSSGTIQKKAWAGYSLGAMSGGIGYGGGSSTNVPSLTLPIGTNNTSSAVREILNIPPSGESPTSAMGKERYYNKANMILLVSNSTVQLMLQSNYTATITLQWTNSLSAFVNTNVSFYDAREGQTVLATEIDAGKLTKWLATNAAVSSVATAPIILYVADNRSAASKLESIRLVNGTTLPTSGFTLATPNPLYVLGHYNVTNSSHLGTTNTSSSVPASLASDALTILSSNWADSKSAYSLGSRNKAVDTTVNAAVLTGIVPSGGADGSSPFSGGVMNVPRLLEDWGNGSKHLTLNTSLVNLFNSARALGAWDTPGVFYYAPSRDFSFDLNFKNPSRLPPGTPQLGTFIRGRWYNAPAGVTNYAGL